MMYLYYSIKHNVINCEFQLTIDENKKQFKYKTVANDQVDSNQRHQWLMTYWNYVLAVYITSITGDIIGPIFQPKS